jgi:hypothetical protein
MQQLTPATLSAILAGLISILATIVPGFRTWFASLAEEVKQSSMAIATAVIAIIVYILACTPSLGFPYIACPTGGIWDLFAAIILSWTANQGVDRIIPKPSDVKAVKAEKKAASAS